MYMDKLFELIGVENHKYFTSNFAMKHNTLGHNDISYQDDSLTQEVGKVALQVCVTTGPGQAAGSLPQTLIGNFRIVQITFKIYIALSNFEN